MLKVLEKGKNGVKKLASGLVIPHQISVQIPAVIGSVLAGGYDSRDGSLRLLDLNTLRELQVLAEKAHVLGAVDAREQVQATIAAGAAVGATGSAQVTVPDDEVWFLNLVELVSPAESGVGVGDIVQVNFRCSQWPDAGGDADGQLGYQNNQGTAALESFYAEFHPGAPFFAVLGRSEPLRLPEGATLTLEAILTGVPAGANLTATLIPYGWKGKKIIA